MAGPGPIPGGLGGIPPELLPPELLAAPLPPPEVAPAPVPIDALGILQPGIGIPSAALDAAARPPPDLGPPDLLGSDLGPPPGPPPWRPYGLDPTALPLPPFSDELAGLAPPGSDAQPWLPPGDTSHLGPLPPPTVPTGAPLFPDAITGQVERSLVGPSDLPFVGDARQAQTPEQRYQALAKVYAGNPDRLLADVLSGPLSEGQQRYLNELALHDQPAFAELGQRVADARDKQIAARQLEIQNRDFDQQMANARIRDEATKATQARLDQVIADAQRISKIDPTGGLSEGGKIAGVLAAAIGGLVQGRTGSPNNAGLDALNTAINRGIEVQKADIANQRAGLDLRRMTLADQIRLNNETYLASETVRLASLAHAEEQLKTMQQNFAPDGVRGLRIAGLRAGIVAQQAATVRDIAHKTLEDEIKIRNSDREAALARETIRHNRAAEGLESARLSLDRAKQKAEGQTFSTEELAAILPPGSPLPPAGKWSIKGYNQWAGAGTAGQELVKRQRENAPVSGLVDSTGEPLHYRKPEDATKVADTLSTVDDLVRATDELVGMIQNNGPQFFKTAAARKALSNYSHILLTSKDNDHLGVLSGSDVDIESKKIGTADPTEIRDAVPGLLQFRHNTVEGFNAKLRAHALLPEGRTIQRWEPKPPPTELSDADALKGDTAIEQGEAAKPGAARELLEPKTSLKNVLFGDELIKKPQQLAENRAATGPTGLALEDNAKVLTAIQQAATATPAQRAAVVDKIAAWAQSPRPSIASGVLGLVRGESPALYDEVVAKLPQEQRDLLPDFANLPLPGANLPPPASLPLPQPVGAAWEVAPLPPVPLGPATGRGQE